MAELWRADVFPEGWNAIARLPAEERGLEVHNCDSLQEANRLARHAWADANFGVWPPNRIKQPDNTPRPRLQMPAASWAPDMVGWGGYAFASARMRYAMALPSNTVQYLPIELIDGSDAAYEQDYKWMAWTVTLPAIDMERSEYTWAEPIDGLTYPRLEQVTRLVWREGADEQAPLFNCAEHNHLLLATETLAWRVDRAGCTGIRFERLRGIGLPPTKPATYRPRAYTPEW